MPDFVITAPDGKKYKVSGPDHAGAVAALKKQLGLPIGPTKQAADIQAPFGQGTVFERPNALAQGGNNVSLRENFSDPLTMATGALGNYVDAAMLGGADEVLAGIRSLGPGTFSQELARLEQARRDYEAQNTGGGVAATGAGLVLNPLNLLGGEAISMGRTALGRTGNAAKYGGTIGVVSGLLGTEGDSGDRLLGAGLGTAGGALLGAAAQPGAELLGFGARKGVEGGRAIYETLKNQAAAKSNPSAQADKLITQAIMRDSALGNPLSPLPGQGMVNMGGENLTTLGRLATVAPGPSRARAAEFFGEQAAGAPDRAADALKGLSDKGYYGTLEALDKGREAAAAPLYKAAREKGASGVWNEHLNELIARPSLGKAWQNAKRIAADRGDALPEIFTMDASGNITGVKQVPDLKAWDYIKRGLDDVIDSNKNQTTGKITTDSGRSVVALKRELLEELDAMVPEYKLARDAYSGPSHSIEMVDKGRDYWRAKGDPADSIREFSNLSPADKDYVRIGMVRDALKDLGNTADAGSVYVKLFNTPNKRALLETVFPDRKAFERFAAQMQAEKQMLASNRTITGGSPTARIEADKADAAMSGASDVLNFGQALGTGNVRQMIAMALDKARNLQRGLTPEVAESVGSKLFEANPELFVPYALSLINRGVPAPVQALSQGWLRNTPLAPWLGQGSGMGGAAIATPAQSGSR